MDPDRHTTGDDETPEGMQDSSMAGTAGADRPGTAETHRPPTSESSGEQATAGDGSLPTSNEESPSAFGDADAVEPAVAGLDEPVSDNSSLAESPPYERPPLHPMMWKINPIAAANNSAAVLAAANRPEVQQQLAASPEAETLPLLGGDGQRPKHSDDVFRSLFLWEAAAAEAIGDPRFTPKPTTKPRTQLAKISRGPMFPAVWVDNQTFQPVLYNGEDEYEALDKRPWQRPAMPSRTTPPPQHGRPEFGDDGPHSQQVRATLPPYVPPSPPMEPDHQSALVAPSDDGGVPGMNWPVIMVRFAEPEKLIEQGLEAIADRMRACARHEAREEVYDYHSWRIAEERALWGKD